MEARTQITSRLSLLEGLRIPAHMQRQAQPPTQQQLQEHLAELLCRDPAVFLERYGAQLLAAELDAFTPLRSDFEVNYWWQQAEQHAAAAAQGSIPDAPSREPPSGKQTSARLSATTKNRRLAYMNRLAASSDFFSEETMRERAPMIWHDFIGQHEGSGDPATAPLPPARPGETFHDQLLRNFDEAQLQARLAAGLQEEECQMSEQEESSEQEEEEETDSSEAEEQQQAQQHRQQQHLVTSANGTTAAAMARLPEAQQPQQQVNPGHEPPAAAAAAADTDMPDAACVAPSQDGGHTRDTSQGAQRPPNQQQQPQQDKEHEQHDPQQHPPQQEQEQAAQRRADFLDEMQVRFLQGLDGGEVDYDAIDGDASLDDDWLDQVTQDAQDAYFDAD
jgi:hypothetical protein